MAIHGARPNASALEVVSDLVPLLVSYRLCVDALDDSPFRVPAQWRSLLLDVVVSLSRVFTQWLVLRKRLPELEGLFVGDATAPPLKMDIHREAQLRDRLGLVLRSAVDWDQFTAPDALAPSIGSFASADCLGALTLHLPEIYEETYRAEEYAAEFVETADRSWLIHLLVSMEHMCRNHAIYVLPVLDRVADDEFW